MNQNYENKLRIVLKEMIRLNIKPNFAALGREYGCDYRTAKVKYYDELNKEKGIENKRNGSTKNITITTSNKILNFNRPRLRNESNFDSMLT